MSNKHLNIIKCIISKVLTKLFNLETLSVTFLSIIKMHLYFGGKQFIIYEDILK